MRLNTGNPDYADELHPHDRFAPPHKASLRCNDACNNKPPAGSTWDEYESSVRYAFCKLRWRDFLSKLTIRWEYK